MIEKLYSIPNITCNHCVHTIQMELEELDVVYGASANAENQQVAVLFSEPADEPLILKLLEEIGYPVRAEIE